MIEFIIDEEYENVRIDRYIRKKMENLYLSDIYKMLRKGKIKVNEKKVSQDYRLVINDRIVVFMTDKSLKNIENNNVKNFINISIEREKILKSMLIYEDKNLFIINKLANEIVHRGSGHDISLLEEYRTYFKNNDVNFVNRIDKSTSGILIGAKNIRTARAISNEIQNRETEKKYYILVHGEIKEKDFIIKNYLKKNEEKVIVSDTKLEGYKESETHYTVIKKNKNYSLLEATLKTGRTHQLRVQLANRGNPIVGDNKYGDDKDKNMFLFSHYLNLKFCNLEINLNIPNYFLKKLNMEEEKWDF